MGRAALADAGWGELRSRMRDAAMERFLRNRALAGALAASCIPHPASGAAGALLRLHLPGVAGRPLVLGRRHRELLAGRRLHLDAVEAQVLRDAAAQRQ